MKKIAIPVICCLIAFICSGNFENSVISAGSDLLGAVTVPDNATYVFYDDFEQYTNGRVVQADSGSAWTGVVTSGFIEAVVQDGNRVARLHADSRPGGTAGPRLEKKLFLGNAPKDITVEFWFCNAFSAEPNQLNIVLEGLLSVNVARLVSGNGWHYVKMVFDFENATASLKIDDTVSASYTLAGEPIQQSYLLKLSSTVYHPNSIYIDNVLIYTLSELNYENMLIDGAGNINYHLAKGKDRSPQRFSSNLKAHPRLFVNDWEAIRLKAVQNTKVGNWYQTLKSRADSLLSAPCVAYAFSNGRNLLAEARTIMNRLYTLAFVYNMEKDSRYLNRAMAEMRNAGEFPDWTNEAPIVACELMSGFAVAYDWLYAGLSVAQRAEIFAIVSEKELYQVIYSYEGRINAEIGMGNTNRTTVANAAVLMTAIAFAGEWEDLGQYLYEHALEAIRPSLGAYTNEGGFPEGAMYWDYSTTYAMQAQAAIDSAVRNGYKLEPRAELYKLPGFSRTPDYSIYLNGMKGKFNFGDANEYNVYSPVLYWFAQKYQKPVYADYLNQNISSFSENKGLIFAMIYYMATDAQQSYSALPKDMVYTKGTASVLTMRSSWTDSKGVFAAMQGGSNSTGHMFLSLGTFVIDAMGERFITCQGQSNYSSAYPAETYYQKRAEGQNTVLANPGLGADQNSNAAARMIGFSANGNEAAGILDMTQTNAAFTEAKRGLKLTNNRTRVVLQDEILLNQSAQMYWFAHTKGNIILSEDQKSAILEVGEKRMLAVITNAPDHALFSDMAATPLETSPVAADEIYPDMRKLAVVFSAEGYVSLTVEFIPLISNETELPTVSPVLPLSDWVYGDQWVDVLFDSTAIGGYMAYDIQNASPVFVYKNEEKPIGISMPELTNKTLAVDASLAETADSLEIITFNNLVDIRPVAKKQKFKLR